MCKKIIVKGRVQGVGFRYFIYKHALKYGLDGYVKNKIDGSVEIVIDGNDSQINEMINVARRGPMISRVDDIDINDCNINIANDGFRITY